MSDMNGHSGQSICSAFDQIETCCFFRGPNLNIFAALLVLGMRDISG